MLPGRKSAVRAGFWPDCYRERTEISPPAGSSPAQIRPGSPISGPEAVLRNIEYKVASHFAWHFWLEPVTLDAVMGHFALTGFYYGRLVGVGGGLVVQFRIINT